MLRVGLTGGMGSGKTTVARIFQTLGVPVYFADEEAKKLMRKDEIIRKAVIEAFGEESYEGTEPNRSFLVSHVLNNEEQIKKLNAIVHPVTISDAQRWMEKQRTPYALKEAAIIFETGSEAYLDYVIGVTAPEEIRIQRIMKRDDRSREEVLQFMSRQMDEKEKMDKCDFVIFNDGKQMLIPQVLQVHKKLSALAQS